MFGNKADNLILLNSDGFNIPQFYVVNDKKEIVYGEYFECNQYSIRSSANVEDGNKNSFAGQFSTYLYVDKKNIDATILKCLNFKENESLKSYINGSNYLMDNIKMNVIVQKMIDSDYSGIIFTSNPKGILNDKVIVVAEGVGKNVVEDLVDSTTYHMFDDDKYYIENGKDILNASLMKELDEIIDKIAKKYGNLKDIEFAIKNNEIYILQMRNITTINTSQISIYDNSNIVESYPGVNMPLTISFAKKIYQGVFYSGFKRLMNDKKLNDQFLELSKTMVDDVNGHMYYIINSWYSILSMLPFNKKMIKIWNYMIGVSSKTIKKQDFRISIFDKIKFGIRFLKYILNNNKNMNTVLEKFDLLYKNYKNEILDNKTVDDLLEYFENIYDEIIDYWDFTLINDMYTFIWTYVLKKYLKIVKKMKCDDITNYITNISNIESLKPVNELKRIIKCKKSLSSSEFENLLNKFVDDYGDRYIGELKLESDTFRTNRKLLYDVIENYQNIDADTEPCINNSVGKQNFLFRNCKDGIALREKSRLDRTRIFGIARSVFIIIGKKLYDLGLLENEKDIFYLSLSDLKSKEKRILYKEIVAKNRLYYNKYLLMPEINKIIFTDRKFDFFYSSIDDTRDENHLMGIACSTGIVEGEAYVVKDKNNLNVKKGAIVVTESTDPGWVYIISSVKGIISEHGSILSHSAIISRELNIPFITNIKKATRIIKNGDIVRINCDTGLVDIVKKANV